MPEDTTNQPQTLTLRINAGADFVIARLLTETKHAWNTDILRSENGVLKVATGEQRDPWPVEHVIQVQVHALRADQCEVIVRHPEPDHAGWPAKMLERIAETYPESRPEIDGHLALIRAASPAVDQVKSEREPPAEKAHPPTDPSDGRLTVIKNAKHRDILALHNRAMRWEEVGERVGFTRASVGNVVTNYRNQYPDLVARRKAQAMIKPMMK